MTATDTRTITAAIARVNGRGFTTVEQPQTWLNLSKYAVPTPVIPPAGSQVQLTLDGSGYVRAIEVLGHPSTNGVLKAPAAAPAAPEAPALRTRDGSIVRMAALKCAVRLTEPGAGVEAVLATARQLEAWITR
jgi:hypothetical protein